MQCVMLRRFSRAPRHLRFSSTSTTTTTSSASTATASTKTTSLLERYARYRPSPLSIQRFLEFGRSSDAASSFLFLRHELPVRLANISRELALLPNELRETEGCLRVSKWYRQSFDDVVHFEKSDASTSTLAEFTSTLMRVRDRHADTVTVMAEALMEVKEQYAEVSRLPKFERSIQYFLDRLYTSRISIRMLINQHTLLFSDAPHGGQDIVGAIDPHCDVLPVVQKAYENARFLAEQYYLNAPELIVRAFDASEKPLPADLPRDEEHRTPVECVYVPSHLYHIFFELFKNAMRATIELHGDNESLGVLPAVKVLIVKSNEDLTIRITDRGGGIPRYTLRQHIFDYLYTTAPHPVITSSGDTNVAMMGTVPLAGYGYGLPLSRLYARYFAGDLELHSVHGYGTSAVVYLRALAAEAMERLPVYNETGSKKIYEAQLAADDWTVSHNKPPFS